MRYVVVFIVVFVIGLARLCDGVENLNAHIPRSLTDDVTHTGFLLSFTDSNPTTTTGSRSNGGGYNMVLRAPVEACPIAPQLGIFLDCSRCQVGAFEQYRNVTVASVHNPYNLWDRTQYLELHLCAEQPIAQAYYVVVHCQQQPTAAPQSVRCEKYNQSRCLYMRPSLIRDIKCPPPSSSHTRTGQEGEGEGDKDKSANSVPVGGVGRGEQQREYVLESVKVSLFRFLLCLLLLLLSGYAGCRWYARSATRLHTRRNNRLWADALSRTFGGGAATGRGSSAGGGAVSSRGSARGAVAANSRRSCMMFSSSGNSSRGTGAVVTSPPARLLPCSPTRIVVVNRQHSPTHTGPSSDRSAAVSTVNEESLQQLQPETARTRGTDSDDDDDEQEQQCVDACMRVLIRSDPNFALQFAKYYRGTNTPTHAQVPPPPFAAVNNPLPHASAMAAPSYSQCMSPPPPHSALPSYQEAISNCAAASVSACAAVDHSYSSPPSPPLPPPPPYSARDPSAISAPSPHCSSHPREEQTTSPQMVVSFPNPPLVPGHLGHIRGSASTGDGVGDSSSTDAVEREREEQEGADSTAQRETTGLPPRSFQQWSSAADA